MRIRIAQIEWRNFRVVSIRADYVLRVGPELGYLHGRKAREMCDLWSLVGSHGVEGILWLDPDVAADPDDLAAMTDAIEADPEDMHTGLVKLWPQSTGLPGWIWSHRGGTIGFPAASQDETAPVAYVSTGFLWTPARLLDLAFPPGQSWQWHEVDVGLSELALTHGITAHTVPGCRPKHLHFLPEHEVPP